jgi:hypothetical protein
MRKIGQMDKPSIDYADWHDKWRLIMDERNLCVARAYGPSARIAGYESAKPAFSVAKMPI